MEWLFSMALMPTPLNTRHLALVKGVAVPVALHVVLQQSPAGNDNQQVASSSSSSSSSSTDSEVESEPGPLLAPLEQPEWRGACQDWQHRQSRTMHRLPAAEAESGSFVCGRVRSRAYFRTKGHLIVDSLKCVQCDKGKTIRSTAHLVQVLEKKRRTA